MEDDFQPKKEEAFHFWKEVLESTVEEDAEKTYQTEEEFGAESLIQKTSFFPLDSESLLFEFPPLSHYSLIEEIALGGMGILYRASQKNLHRDVVIKKIREDIAQKPRKKERFIAEAIVTALLDHPNIVPIYELGQDTKEELLLSMKLVKGKTWKQLLHPKTLEEKKGAKAYSQKQHLDILVQVCHAVAFAHSKNVVHNDLKPENIIIGEFGEVFVMDWGIAVDIQNPPRVLPILKKSEIKRPMGTPNYIAPELAMGRGDWIGAWTDVYLLGAILYEIITGKPPHKSSSIQEALTHAIEGKLPPLPEDVPHELAQICTKSLKKNPIKRYANVLHFQKAILDFLEHRESLKLAKESLRILQSCQNQLKKNARRKENYLQYEPLAQSISGFRQALLLWDGNILAEEGKQSAHFQYARLALQNDDIHLAKAQTEELLPSQAQKKLFIEVEQAQKIKARSQKMMRYLRWGLSFAVLVILLGLVGFILVIRYEQRQTALQYATLYTKSLSEFRSLYSSAIVSRVQPQGIEVTHEYTTGNGIPFPATFSIELAKKISAGQDGLKARLYSDYPFPWRRQEGGIKDDFEREALEFLRENPDLSYYRLETVENVPSMRFAKAVRLTESCVNCHNTHPQTPKKGWKTGEVRGVQEITIPIGSTSQKIKDISKELFFSKYLFFGICLLMVLGTGIFFFLKKKNIFLGRSTG